MAKLFVIKIGGNVIDNEDALHNFLKDFAALEGKKNISAWWWENCNRYW
jgi:acetylglutamate kinase